MCRLLTVMIPLVFLASSSPALCAERNDVATLLNRRIIDPNLPLQEVQAYTEARVPPMPEATAVADWERVTGQRCPFSGLLFDPKLNIEIGTWYLAQALGQWHDYRDREVLALAQYNAGRTRAKKWAPEDKRENVRRKKISFPSTREYISKVLEAKKMFEKEPLNSEKH